MPFSMTQRAFLILPFLFATCLGLQAEPKLPHLFSDHMVLQQGREIPIWGWADVGEAIQVTPGTATRSTTTEKDGREN